MSGALTAARTAWRAVLDPSEIIGDRAVRNRLCRNTLAILRDTPLVLRPMASASIPDILRIAAQHRVALYPISTGRNWGYGCAAPITDGAVVLDLSKLRKIELIDTELGLVKVEPGVTQGDLANYLAEHELPFMVPVTGAGPDASILGNAIERGYGLTPTADHFAAVTSLRVALVDGSIYQPPLAEAGAGLVDACFKWGVGPYLDGIFTQSNLGVVLDATVALARRPERILPFLFTIRQDEDLEWAVTVVRELISELGSTLGGINLINRRRMLAMVEPYPFDQVSDGGVIPDEIVMSMARRHALGAWTGVGCLYGPAGLVEAAMKHVKRRLRAHASRLVFLHPRTLAVARWAGRIPGIGSRVAPIASRLQAAVENFSGRPSDIALPLAWWRNRSGVPAGRLDPSRDGSGLIWYSPLVPMRSDLVRRYTIECERICRSHGIEPAITLTSCSDRCFDSTVPLLFERDVPAQHLRALTCYDELIEAGRKLGFMPYRFAIHAMDHIVDSEATCWRVGAALKAALDPAHVIAPGRYCLPPIGKDAPQATREAVETRAEVALG